MKEKIVTVIIPIYNCEEYLDEAIGSLINQSIGFKEYIRVYLIDDKSTDSSLEICKKYEKQFPENIKVHQMQENGGPSKARNYALSLLKKEKYPMAFFMDSDDKLGEDVIEKVYKYMENHPKIEIASTEMYYFDAMEGPHKLNGRFEVSDVMDIKENYIYPQFYIGGIVIRKRSLKKLFFDETMVSFEDAVAVNEQIIRKGKYGLVKDAVYYYRKRQDESSLVNTNWYKKEKYLPLLEKGYLRLFKYSRRYKWKYIPYVQYLVAYHMRLFLMPKNNEKMYQVLNEEEITSLKCKMTRLLKWIEDDVLLQIPTTVPILEALFSLKYEKKVRFKREFADGECYIKYNDTVVATLSDRNVAVFGISENEKIAGMLYGRFGTTAYAMKSKDYIFIENNGERIDCIRRKSKKRYVIFGEDAMNFKHCGFAVDVPADWQTFRFGIHTEKGEVLLNTFDMSSLRNGGLE